MGNYILFFLDLSIISFAIAETPWTESLKHDTIQKATIQFARNPVGLHILERLDGKIYQHMVELTKNVLDRAADFPSVSDFIRVSQNLTSYLQDYKESTIKLSEYKSEYTQKYRVGWNPLASFRMLYRLVYDLPVLVELLESSTDFVVVKRAEILDLLREWKFNWPTDLDVSYMIEQIVLIQTVYHLRAEDMAEGILFNRDTKVKLRSMDCMTISNYASDVQLHSIAVYWALAALKILEKSSNTVLLAPAQSTLESVITEHDMNWMEDGESFFTRLIGDDLENLVYQGDVNFENERAKKRVGWSSNSKYVLHNLCMGNSYQTTKEQSELFCWYERKTSPYLTINPVKAELLSKDPLIVHYYEIVSTKQIKVIRKAVMPYLDRSHVVLDDDSTLEESTRSSVDATFEDSGYEETKSLPKLLSSITGFQLRNLEVDSEAIQVVVYAVGAYYDLHIDALETPQTAVAGDRIATMVLYLSGVELGGGTAFSYPGIVVEPVKGSMVFWYNLEASGQPDQRTYHSGCPIILGEKWIANQWVRANSQFRSHPCQEGMSTFRFHANGFKLQ